MKLVGNPFAIQNTDGPNWLVRWEDAITTTDGEAVTFTVAIPRQANLPIAEAQRYAMQRAVELLQKSLAGMA